MKTKHPALDLFDKLFNEAASKDSPYMPQDFVPRTWFAQKCRESGIDCPSNFNDQIEWEGSIGLRNHVRKVVAAYRKQHGLKMTPMERGAFRLERRLAQS